MNLRYYTKLLYRSLPRQVTQFLNFHLEEKKLDFEVALASSRIKALSKECQGNKLFIDCGFNSGYILQAMMKQLPDFNAYGFEANERVFKFSAETLLRDPRILGLDFSAVSTTDGTVDFHEIDYSSKVCPMQASTIIEGLDPEKDRESVTQIKSVDFSNWLSDIFNKHTNGADPFIALKMDIEGAEYDVLERMIENGTMAYVGYLAVEFHARRFPEAQRRDIQEREIEIKEHIAALPNIYLHEWF